MFISSSNWCLFLDVDGTLLDLAATPQSVQVDPALHALLTRLSSALQGAVALISGRPIVELDRLFHPQRWPAAGVHGLERRDASGRWHPGRAPDADALARARLRLQELAGRLPGTIVEDKGLAVALHYRQAPVVEGQARRAMKSIAADSGGKFRLLEGRMVFELQPQGATKADAMRAFLSEQPFAGRRPIFIGDDVTDENALVEAERLGGLSVAVGDRVVGMVQVASPRDVRVFLEELALTGAPVD